MVEIRGLKLLYSEECLKKRIRELGAQISEDYRDQELLCVCVLKGAIFFFTDLVRTIENQKLMVDFLKASSYGSGIYTSYEVKIVKDLNLDIKGRHVLLVEDVIDSGITMQKVIPMLRAREAADVRLCALIDKRERREVDIPIDYTGFVLNKGFIVGYGLDLAEKYRQLPAIYEAVIEEN